MKRATIFYYCIVLFFTFSPATLHAKNYNSVSNLSQVQLQGQMALKIYQEIEQGTAGRIRLLWHDSGDLIPIGMHLNAVSSGSVPCAFTAFAYFGGILPIANFYSGYPFSPGAEEWFSWLFYGDGLKILQETLDPMNIVAIPIMFTPREAGGFFNREIKNADDFKGLRFRIGGWGGEVMAHMGVAISQIPVNELYMAMERGRIDALEFGSPSINMAWGFDKLARYYYFPGWHQPIGMQWFLVNKKVWESWSKEDQDLIISVCRNNIMPNYLVLEQLDAEAVAQLDASPDIEVIRFSEPVLEALNAAWNTVLAQGMHKHPEIKKAYASFMDYQKKTNKLRELQDLTSLQGR